MDGPPITSYENGIKKNRDVNEFKRATKVVCGENAIYQVNNYYQLSEKVIELKSIVYLCSLCLSKALIDHIPLNLSKQLASSVLQLSEYLIYIAFTVTLATRCLSSLLLLLWNIMIFFLWSLILYQLDRKYEKCIIYLSYSYIWLLYVRVDIIIFRFLYSDNEN